MAVLAVPRIFKWIELWGNSVNVPFLEPNFQVHVRLGEGRLEEEVLARERETTVPEKQGKQAASDLLVFISTSAPYLDRTTSRSSSLIATVLPAWAC